MPNCQNCGQKWDWKTTFVKSIKFNSGVECPYCGKPQYVTSATRKKSSFLSFIPAPVLIFSNLIFDMNVAAFTLLAVSMFAVIFMIVFPYIIDLTSDNEPLW